MATKQTPDQADLSDLVNGLTKARDHVIETLQKHNFGMLAINAETNLNKVINMLVQTAGNGAFVAPTATMQFPPITDFMGSPVKNDKKAVTEEQLSPKEFRKQQFEKDVEALLNSFADREDENILEAHSLPEHQLVLRGVAKNAGLEDFKTGEVNLDFISRIRAGLEAKEAAAQKKAAGENKIKAAGSDDDLK